MERLQGMNVGANIRRIRKEKKMTLEDVATKIDTDTGNLSRIERGLQSYTDEGLKRIARALGVPVPDFFVEQSTAHYAVARSARITVPVFDVEASMGMGRAQPENETVIGNLQLSEQWVRRNLNVTSPTNLAMISAYGDSMSPTFSDGDVLFIDRGVNTISLDAVYVFSLNNELFIKRVQRKMDGTVVIKSDNPLYDPHVVKNDDRDSLQILGRVLWAWNGKKL